MQVVVTLSKIVFVSLFENKTKAALHSFEVSYFNKKRTTSLMDFPFVSVQGRNQRISNKDYVIDTKHFLLSVAI